MPAITTLLSIFLTMAMGAMAASIVEIISEPLQPSKWMFVVFYMSLRVKFYLDDLEYCKSSNRKSKIFKAEFIVGMVIWFLWIVSAALLPENFAACLLTLLFALLIATFSLLLSHCLYKPYSVSENNEGCEKETSNEKTSNKNAKWFQNQSVNWLLFNLGYIALLFCAFFLHSNDNICAIFLLLANILAVLDYIKQTPFSIFEK